MLRTPELTREVRRIAPHHRLPRTRIVNRDNYLLQVCRGQDVLHLACNAWPATRELYDSGQLLHRKLLGVCRTLAGNDNDPAGLQLLRDYGVNNLYLADLLDPRQVDSMFTQLSFRPQWILAGELLEHLDSPGILLRNLRRHMDSTTRLLITVPNAFAVKGFLHVLRGYEKVRTDHVAYYSYANLRELLRRADLEMDEFHWYRETFRRRPMDRVIDWMLSPLLYVRPQFAAGMLAVCRLGESTQGTRT